MLITSPEKFEEIVAPVSGVVNVRPARGAKFITDLQLSRLGNVGLFTVRAKSFQVSVEPPHDFFSLTIPLDLPFYSHQKNNQTLFTPGTAHLLHPNDQFKLSAADGFQTLVSNFFVSPLEDYICRLNQSETASIIGVNSQLSLSTPAGIILQRAVAQAWAKIHHNKTNMVSDLWLKEMEDELIACFINATGSQEHDKHTLIKSIPAHMKIAEDFLCANLETPVTRDRLAEASGVSMRTLSRTFLKYYGMGPIGFLKQRRFEAAYRTLLGAEPGTTTVTDTALRYGFIHMGKFSIEYRQIFGESPSTSLSR